ncbi:uncharacterized protein [Hoplias malabaricus]|uniref:uncharacterized protein isoform X2 n=1 Tax=Hoplias malabaricus TaxID=27720 RepID=UPI003461FAC8
MEVVLILVLLLAPGFKEHLVEGDVHMVSSSVGENLILNCSINSTVLQLEEVTWRKLPDTMVLLFQENQTFSESSHETYRDRVEFFSSEIPRGNFSLKLKDVRLKDKGEFICEVHTDEFTAQTSVIIQRIGFSSLQKFILVLCFFSLALALGLGFTLFIILQKKEISRRVMIMHIILTCCPSICMFISFILRSKEGFLNEVVICSTLSLARCLMLMRTAPHLNTLPEWLQKALKTMSVPLYFSIVGMAAFSVEFVRYKGLSSRQFERAMMFVGVMIYCVCSVLSAKFTLREISFLFLELYNGNLFSIFLHDQPRTPGITNVISGVFMTLCLFVSLQIHCFQNKPFKCLHIFVSAIFVASACVANISTLVGLDIAEVWCLLFTTVLYIVVWLALIFVLRYLQEKKNHRCCKWRGVGYLCCAGFISVMVVVNASCYLYFIRTYIIYKDSSIYLVMMILLNIVAPAALFDHPTHPPRLPHVILHVFGASGLSIVYSIILASELLVEAETGTLPEFYLIIFPFESLFISAWICLHIYCSWMKMRDRIKNNFEDGREAGFQVDGDGGEMEVLSTDSRQSPEKGPEDSSLS